MLAQAIRQVAQDEVLQLGLGHGVELDTLESLVMFRQDLEHQLIAPQRQQSFALLSGEINRVAPRVDESLDAAICRDQVADGPLRHASSGRLPGQGQQGVAQLLVASSSAVFADALVVARAALRT